MAFVRQKGEQKCSGGGDDDDDNASTWLDNKCQHIRFISVYSIRANLTVPGTDLAPIQSDRPV